MRLTAFALFPLLAACGSTDQEEFFLSFDPEGASVLRVDTNDGDITVNSADVAAVEVAGVSFGRGVNEDRAQEALEGNRWGGSVADGVVSVFGSASDRGQVDLFLTAPDRLTADLVAGGTATLEGLEGSHVVTADRVVARNLGGEADLYARERGMDVELMPWNDAHIRLQSHGGDVVVYLPYGLDYDLRIFGDPEHELTVADLGFDFTHLGVGAFAGERGTGEVEVSIHVEGGDVTVREAGNR
ncbi:MAG: hypothetical protein EP330_00265 [Deltaproteobacteria bacterium]|nr:MAG: hypothetical protein EP330_00265 [Deltaproteobacteria bacterium]